MWVGFFFVLLLFWSLMAAWLCLAQSKSSIMRAGSDLEVTPLEDGHLHCSSGGELLGRSLLDPVPKSGASTNQGMQTSSLLFHSTLLTGKQKELQMESGCFVRTSACSALLWILLPRKQWNKKERCFSERCPCYCWPDEFAG